MPESIPITHSFQGWPLSDQVDLHVRKKAMGKAIPWMITMACRSSYRPRESTRESHANGSSMPLGWRERKGLSAHRVGRLWEFQISELNEWVCVGKSDESISNDKQKD